MSKHKEIIKNFAKAFCLKATSLFLSMNCSFVPEVRKIFSNSELYLFHVENNLALSKQTPKRERMGDCLLENKIWKYKKDDKVTFCKVTFFSNTREWNYRQCYVTFFSMWVLLINIHSLYILHTYMHMLFNYHLGWSCYATLIIFQNFKFTNKILFSLNTFQLRKMRYYYSHS